MKILSRMSDLVQEQNRTRFLEDSKKVRIPLGPFFYRGCIVFLSSINLLE